MRAPNSHRVALLHLAKDLPKSVERYVQEGLDKGMDESKAWAIAWSRYCKYKEPGSPHCQMETSEYLPNQGKTAAGGNMTRGYLELLMKEAARTYGYSVAQKGPMFFSVINKGSGLKVVGSVKTGTLEMYPIDAQSPFELIKKGELTGVPSEDLQFYASAR